MLLPIVVDTLLAEYTKIYPVYCRWSFELFPVLYEGGNRTGSLLKAGLHLGPHCGLSAVCPLSMEMTYQLENQASGRKSPRALHRLKEYPNYLCN